MSMRKTLVGVIAAICCCGATVDGQLAKVGLLGGAIVHGRVTGATPSTPLTVATGNINNINDNNPATTVSVIGGPGDCFFFLLDLGSSKTILTVEAVGLYETAGADSGFHITYSDTALDCGNQGTTYYNLPNISTTPTTYSGSGSAAGRYWGIIRAGDFTGVNIGLGDFNVYQ